MNCNLHAKINPLLPKLLVIEVFDHSGLKGTRASLSLIWRRKKSELRNGNDLLRVLQLHAEPIPQPIPSLHFSGTLEYCFSVSYWVPWVSRRDRRGIRRFPFGSLCWDEKYSGGIPKNSWFGRRMSVQGQGHGVTLKLLTCLHSGKVSFLCGEQMTTFMCLCAVYVHTCVPGTEDRWLCH